MATDNTITRGEQTRQAILDAAEELFLAQGYNGTSMRQIASKAGGIAVGGIYNHFGGKEDIFRELLKMRSPYDKLLSTLESFEGNDGPTLLSEAFPRLQEIISDHVGFFRLVLIDVNEFNGKTIRSLISHMIPRLVRFVQRLRSADGIRTDVDPFVLLRTIASMMIGYTITNLIGYADGKLQFTNAPDYDHAYWMNAMVDLLLRGVAADE